MIYKQAKRESKFISVYISILILCIFSFSSGFSGYARSVFHVNCLQNENASTKLEFIISYPYTSNITYPFPTCGIPELEKIEIYQEVNKASSASFSITCSFLGLIYTVLIILHIFFSERDVFYLKYIQNKDLAIEMILCAIYAIFFFASTIIFSFLAINIRMVTSVEYFAKYIMICNEHLNFMQCSVNFDRYYSAFFFAFISYGIITILFIARIVQLIRIATKRREKLLDNSISIY